MNKTCPNCSYNFYKEPGYYTGAMFLQYLAAAVLVLPTLLWGAYVGTTESLVKAGVLSCVEIVVTSPFFFRYSRLFWIHMSTRL